MHNLVFIIFLLGVAISAQTRLKEELRAGETAYEKENWDKAEQKFRMALGMDNESVAAHYNLGNALAKNDKPQQAISHFRQASEITTDTQVKHRALHNLGNAYMAQQKWEEAEKSFKDALKLNPSDDETRYNYALARKKNKQQQEQQKQEEKSQPEQKQDQGNQNDSDAQNQEQENQSKEQNQGKDPQGNQQDNQKGQAIKPGDQNDEAKGPQGEKDVKRFSEGIMQAVERQEKETYKRIIQQKARRSRSKNKKDW